MAYGEDYSDYTTEQQQDVLYDAIGFGNLPSDPELHDLFYTYFYDDYITLDRRIQIYDELVERITDVYGIDFATTWDWEDFRAWYESVG